MLSALVVLVVAATPKTDQLHFTIGGEIDGKFVSIERDEHGCLVKFRPTRSGVKTYPADLVREVTITDGTTITIQAPRVKRPKTRVLKPSGPREKTPMNEKLGFVGLSYSLHSKRDVSYANYKKFPAKKRMVWNMVLKQKTLPSRAEIKATVEAAWRDGNTRWDEFTAFVWLPDQTVGAEPSYAVGELRPSGLKHLQLNKDSYELARKLEAIRKRRSKDSQ